MESKLPTDVESLQLLIGDLSRRLKNSIQLLESQKGINHSLLSRTELYESKLRSISLTFNLEISKFDQSKRNILKKEEEDRIERENHHLETLNREYRLQIIDHGITNTKKKPIKLLKLKDSINQNKLKHISQLQFLEYVRKKEQLVDEIACACQNGDLFLCKTLFRNGACINQPDSAGFLPLHYASMNGHYEIIQFLLENGSDVTSLLTGYPPLVLAARGGHSQVIQLLSLFGASVDDVGQAGAPPIVSAAAGCQNSCIETLLSLGAEINATDIDGNTPLHAAVMQTNCTSTIQLLLLHGANIKISNKSGLTPIQLALNTLNQEALEALGGRALKH